MIFDQNTKCVKYVAHSCKYCRRTRCSAGCLGMWRTMVSLGPHLHILALIYSDILYRHKLTSTLASKLMFKVPSPAYSTVVCNMRKVGPSLKKVNLKETRIIKCVNIQAYQSWSFVSINTL